MPKLKETVQQSLTAIIEDHIKLLQQGTLEGEEPASIEDVEWLIMQSLEIFLDSTILPAVNQKFNPLVSESTDNSATENSDDNPEG